MTPISIKMNDFHLQQNLTHDPRRIGLVPGILVITTPLDPSQDSGLHQNSVFGTSKIRPYAFLFPPKNVFWKPDTINNGTSSVKTDSKGKRHHRNKKKPAIFNHCLFANVKFDDLTSLSTGCDVQTIITIHIQ